LFNNSIESGIFPVVFKISKVTDPGNYRPIAVLSPFAKKILERLVYNQLNHFLEKENILLTTNLASGKIISLTKQFSNSQTILT